MDKIKPLLMVFAMIVSMLMIFIGMIASVLIVIQSNLNLYELALGGIGYSICLLALAYGWKAF